MRHDLNALDPLSSVTVTYSQAVPVLAPKRKAEPPKPAEPKAEGWIEHDGREYRVVA